MLIVLLLTIALNVVLVIKIPKGFFPQQDTGALVGGLQGPQDASFPVMDASVRALVKVVKADPAVANVISLTPAARDRATVDSCMSRSSLWRRGRWARSM